MLVEMYMKGILKMEFIMVKEFIYLRMEINMKENGYMVKEMVNLNVLC